MTKQGEFKNCQRCSKAFYAYPYNAAVRRYCSTACANKENSPKQRLTKRERAKQNLGSKKWRYNLLYIEWRNNCIVRDKSKCQSCGRDVNSRTIAVHHIKSWESYPDLRYNVDNGLTLCRSCHNRIHILPSRKERSGF